MRPIYGWPENIPESRTMPTLIFTKFLMGFVTIDPINVRTKFEVRSFTRSCDNKGTQKRWAVPGYAHTRVSPKFLKDFCLEGFLWIYRPNLNMNLGGHRGWKWYHPKERWWVPPYRLFLYRSVFQPFQVFSEEVPFAAILIAHGTHVLWGRGLLRPEGPKFEAEGPERVLEEGAASPSPPARESGGRRRKRNFILPNK